MPTNKELDEIISRYPKTVRSYEETLKLDIELTQEMLKDDLYGQR